MHSKSIMHSTLLLLLLFSGKIFLFRFLFCFWFKKKERKKERKKN